MVSEKIEKLREFYNEGNTLDVSFRLKQLGKLKDLISSNEDKIIEALNKDFNKSRLESYLSEIDVVVKEIDKHISNLKKWVKPKSVKTPISQWPGSNYTLSEPYGVCLIMAPWNYPFQLIMAPLIGAISAGNCSVLKPSEVSPHVASLIEDLVPQYFESNYITVINGGVETSQKLLAQKFDYIFYTGAEFVGKIVMRAASEHLTPVTLELGGKNPCVVDKEIDIEVAARRIAWGKMFNWGQTCIAPDFVYVHSSVKEKFLKHLKAEFKNQLGDSKNNIENYQKIINEKHFLRLNKFLQGSNIIYGGFIDQEKLFMEPTVISINDWSHSSMQEEIFGPVLPILEFSDHSDLINLLKQKAKPLSFYLFSDNKKLHHRYSYELSYGNLTINDCLVQYTNSELPFGGVGNSGMGSYHGKSSFDTFSHVKTITKRKTIFDVSIRYRPYTEKNLKLLRNILRKS